MLSTRTFVAITSTGCAALVVLLLLDYDAAAAAAKLVASTAFLATAVQVGALRSAYGRAVLMGLLLSWCGDAFLIDESQQAFLLGLGAFLLAHVAYVAAFILKGISLRWLSVAALPVTLIAVVVSMWLAPHVAPYLVTPVRTYTVVISLMVVAAIGTRGRGASPLIVAGALLFFLSDLSVAALRLIQTGVPTYVWGLPLYYAGQTLLALSTSQSRSH